MSIGLHAEVDIAPLVAVAQRCGRPLEEIADKVAALIWRGNAEQFSAQATYEGTSTTSWPTSMRETGALEAAWTGGAGSFVDSGPRFVVTGVASPDYVAPWQRDEPAHWPSGRSEAPRRLGVGQATLEAIALLEATYMAGSAEDVEAGD